MPEVIHFDDAIDASGASRRSALLGNGFSIAQSGGQFSYAALLEKSELRAGSPIRKVFDQLRTKDFEEVVNALEHASTIEEAYGNMEQANIFRGDAGIVRDALIHAVHKVHPGVSIDIPDSQRESCADFLNNFDKIFTLNYDLLMYWVILSGCQNHSDGFGLGQKINGFRTFSTEANCSTYYVHGALHLFLNSALEVQKRVLKKGAIINEIASFIRETGRLPLFVAEGTATQKMAKINSVPYLRHCYDAIADVEGSIFVFGHSASANDTHIYDAIFRSKIDKMFFCIHEPNGCDWTGIVERLAPYSVRRPDVNISYVDAGTAAVWG